MEQKNGFNAVLFICNTSELVFVNARIHEPDKNDWNAFVLLSKIKKNFHRILHTIHMLKRELEREEKLSTFVITL